MFTEFDAKTARWLAQETVDQKFRREYYELRDAAAPAPKAEFERYHAPQTGPSERESAFLKVARFIRLA
jgi:hypothetical protein